MISIESNTIFYSNSIRSALEKLTSLGENLTLFVIDDQEILIGVLTDGDIRRGLIKGFSLDEAVSNIMNKEYKYLTEQDIYYNKNVENFNSSIKIMPVLDINKKIIRFVNLTILKALLPIDVVLIAGGRGERLLPLTKNTPKPMLDICGKPILEHNIDLLIKYGINNFHISINYLKNVIKNYFLDGSQKNVNINYIEEEKPLGTIGSVKLSNSYINNDILILNSDIITNLNFADFYKTFKETNADILIATTSYTVNVPYAVLDVENGLVNSLKEKPTYNYFSNAGIYLIKQELINQIPLNQVYNATDLINKLIELNKSVRTYSILGYWLDIGRHEDYSKAQNDFMHISF
jgi:dTDP-glucose pyrophosphorylase